MDIEPSDVMSSNPDEDGKSKTNEDYRQLEYERFVLYLRILLYVHLFFAAVYITLRAARMGNTDQPWLVPVFVIGTPLGLAVLYKCRHTKLFKDHLHWAEFVITWELFCFYIQVTLFSDPDGPGLFPMFVVALVMTLRAALVPSTTLRTFWLGFVPMTAIIVLCLTLDRPHEPLFMVIWNGVVGYCFVATTVVTSKVIYGLQRKLSDIKKLGQYELGKKLGEGGMGKVYMAHHAMLRRQAAVKVLSEGGQVSQNAAERFRNEVQMTCRLSHPNTVQVFDYGVTAGGQFFYAMEYLDGATLQALVDTTGPMSSARVAYVLEKVTASLVEAHGAGLLHRDIKPANIMLCKLGGMHDSVKVLDFGLVQTINADKSGEAKDDDGRLEGTPSYLAPECIVDAAGSEPRSDLYALGAVGYFMLCGASPFEGTDIVDLLAKHLTESPVRPSERLGRKIDPELESIILQCLEKDPALRPESAEALWTMLTGVSERLTWTLSERAVWWAEHEAVIESYREAAMPSMSRTGHRSRIGRASYLSKGVA